ncbi:unnamed protein product [Parascedosporium putredinis]|uniref:Transcription factor domain-containing protein n=1 Tax=Parascedosporium putredinis TaxID=1442378 RepID=A0A9P1H632_9PEZI|nr:unnamed protein product [Parascedosporium putredinis]CAI7996998.1 unnamed protein product [Parascedosporium putredinis]
MRAQSQSPLPALCREKHIKCYHIGPVTENIPFATIVTGSIKVSAGAQLPVQEVTSFRPQVKKRRKRRLRHDSPEEYRADGREWPGAGASTRASSCATTQDPIDSPGRARSPKRATRSVNNNDHVIRSIAPVSPSSPSVAPTRPLTPPLLQNTNPNREELIQHIESLSGTEGRAAPVHSSGAGDNHHATNSNGDRGNDTGNHGRTAENGADEPSGDLEDGFPLGRIDTGSSVMEDYVSPSGDVLYQNPPAVFGLPLTATIATHHHVYGHAESSAIVTAAAAVPPSIAGTATAARSVVDVATPTPQLQIASPYDSHHPPDASAVTRSENPHTESGAHVNYTSHTNPKSHLDLRSRHHHRYDGFSTSDTVARALAPPAPLHSREAHLIKFFMQTFGPLLDCNDPERHFTMAIPQLALTKAPCLLSAILTISALQLSRVSDYPISAARQYRRQCGRLLIPVLEDLTNREMEGAIFGTYVLLRIYDQMTVELRGCHPDTLFSSSLALSTSPWSAYMDKEGSLKRAAFWVHIREDIHVALFLRWPIKIDCPLFQQNLKAIKDLTKANLAERRTSLEPPGLRLPRPDIECAWSNHIIGLTCHVINFCFGPEQGKSVETWAVLLSQVECWNLEKPDTFAPFHEHDAEPEQNQVFPTILLSCDWHVIGLLYYHLSLILLKSHRPGQAGSLTTLHGKGEIINHTRILCGIVISNPIAQALIVACHMIIVAGIFLENPAEQREVLQLLHMARTATGWPVDEVEKRLKDAWG